MDCLRRTGLWTAYGGRGYGLPTADEAKNGEMVIVINIPNVPNLAPISQNFIFSFSYRDFSHFGARFGTFGMLLYLLFVYPLLILLFSFIKRKK